MKVTVAQLGARRHYAVPLALQQRDMLARFHTDFYVGSGIAGTLGSIAPFPALRRAGARQDAGLELHRVKAHPLFGLRYRAAKRRATNAAERTAAWMWGGRRFCELVVRHGLPGCDAVYAYSSAAWELFQHAKANDRICILDHATAPKTAEDALVAAQHERYPGWAEDPQSDANAEAYTQRQREECEQANLIICGSTFVRKMLENTGVAGEKLLVVPLGLRSLPDRPSRPERQGGPLRVLFVGDDMLRKGLGDLVQALRSLGPGCCETRVVGHPELTDHGRREAEPHVDFLGRIPRDQMTHQYAWADILVLPSVSDTFALVILEAMAHGVPVVTTPNTGGPDVIDDGRDGWIVPIHDPQTLAQRLALLYDDRSQVLAAAAAAREKAEQFTIDAYGQRLAQAISSAGRPAAEATNA